MGDGSTRFVSEDIDLGIWRATSWRDYGARAREAGVGHVRAARDEPVLAIADLDEKLVLAAVLAGDLSDPLLEVIRAHDDAQVAEAFLEPIVDLLDEGVPEALEHVHDLQRHETHDRGEHRERDAQTDASVHGAGESM